MHFDLVDAVVDSGESRIVTLKHVSNAEEYLLDHFPGYPVLPGVMMIEALVQAARRLLDPGDRADPPWVLGAVRGLKYGAFVRPGSTLRVEVSRHKGGEGAVEFKGDAVLIEPGADPSGTSADPKVAVSGRFVMRRAV